MNCDLGIIGAGNMAEAIVRRIVSERLIAAEAIVVADPAEARREVFTTLGARAVADNAAVIADCPTLLLAIKPQTLDQLADELASVDPAQQVVMSILAGVSTTRLQSMLP
ncbi:MAG: NAD(P)-binding domain-containing protein, partial [Alphaproteobacteria bacterium]|nr:NAD(P)-binding domain-containing protein [Alphaproteobacteria bacterium]